MILGNKNLIISRKVEEEVILFTEDGKRIAVKIIDVDKKKVRMSFSAPGCVKIMRSELLERNDNER